MLWLVCPQDLEANCRMVERQVHRERRAVLRSYRAELARDESRAVAKIMDMPSL
jgi:hypothetical protein